MMTINGGDLLAVQGENSGFYGDAVLNGTTAVTAHASRSSNHTIYVQRLVLSITTHAAKTVTVKDSAGLVIAAHLDAAAEASGIPPVVEWNFGPHGVALGAGKDLIVVTEASGVAGLVHYEGYEKLSSVISLSTPNTQN
jgi:hypothetical protein